MIIFGKQWVKYSVLLKLFHPFLISFNVSTRKLKIASVAHFLFSLDRAGLEYC